jgi:hypothetical protein
VRACRVSRPPAGVARSPRSQLRTGTAKPGAGCHGRRLTQPRFSQQVRRAWHELSTLQRYGVHVPGRQIKIEGEPPDTMLILPAGFAYRRASCLRGHQPLTWRRSHLGLWRDASLLQIVQIHPFYKASIDDEVAKWDGWWVLLFSFMHAWCIDCHRELMSYYDTSASDLPYHLRVT